MEGARSGRRCRRISAGHARRSVPWRPTALCQRRCLQCLPRGVPGAEPGLARQFLKARATHGHRAMASAAAGESLCSRSAQLACAMEREHRRGQRHAARARHSYQIAVCDGALAGHVEDAGNRLQQAQLQCVSQVVLVDELHLWVRAQNAYPHQPSECLYSEVLRPGTHDRAAAQHGPQVSGLSAAKASSMDSVAALSSAYWKPRTGRTGDSSVYGCGSRRPAHRRRSCCSGRAGGALLRPDTRAPPRPCRPRSPAARTHGYARRAAERPDERRRRHRAYAGCPQGVGECPAGRTPPWSSRRPLDGRRRRLRCPRRPMLPAAPPASTQWTRPRR